MLAIKNSHRVRIMTRLNLSLGAHNKGHSKFTLRTFYWREGSLCRQMISSSYVLLILRLELTNNKRIFTYNVLYQLQISFELSFINVLLNICILSDYNLKFYFSTIFYLPSYEKLEKLFSKVANCRKTKFYLSSFEKVKKTFSEVENEKKNIFCQRNLSNFG